MGEFEPDIVRVHVDNIADLKHIQISEEHEPEHFSCRTYTVQTGGAGQVQENTQRYVKILELNPMRKEAAILSLDSTVVLCHSEAQANSQANNVAALPAPDGVPLGAGQNVSVEGTGPLWAVATVATVSRVRLLLISGDHDMGMMWGSGGNAALTVPLLLQGVGANPVIGIGVTGDVTNRLELRANGQIALGAGAVAPDATLTRTGNNSLQVGGVFQTASVSGNFFTSTAGAGLRIKGGANAKIGTGTLVAGTVTIATTAVTAASLIWLCDTSNGANLGILSVGVITPGVSFVVNSNNALDAGTFNWLIIEPG